jgi:protein MBA1
MQLGLKLRDYVSLVILKITSPQGARWYNRLIKLHRGRVVPTAIALHREMYHAFAAGDTTTLRRICTDGIYDQVRARISSRPRGEKTVWELVKYNKRAKILSHRAARLPLEGAAVRQAVVRISSRQKLSRYAADGALVKGTGKERDVVEYLVVEKSYWNWKEGDWRVWGTTEETKFETLLQWKKDDLEA